MGAQRGHKLRPHAGSMLGWVSDRCRGSWCFSAAGCALVCTNDMSAFCSLFLLGLDFIVSNLQMGMDVTVRKLTFMEARWMEG